jgi:ribosomal protein S18 acetylase RimI-like enzyme
VQECAGAVIQRNSEVRPAAVSQILHTPSRCAGHSNSSQRHTSAPLARAGVGYTAARGESRNVMSDSLPTPVSVRPNANPAFSLRAAGAEDREFLLRLYASTREEEMAAWGWNAAQREAFVQMQFTARERSYEALHPGAERQIVLLGNDPVGAMIVLREPAGMRLVDIAMLPDQRNRGLGASLIGGLIAEAARAGAPLKLSVLRGNKAARLYERLGFARTGEDEMYIQMEHSSS